MLAGKWISKMFDAEEMKNIIIEKERFNYEFTFNQGYKELETKLGNYFHSNFNFVKYLSSESGKVSILNRCILF